MTVNRPWTCSPTAANSAIAAVSADYRRAPFARASEADRICAPGYSWPPHLYQDKLSLADLRTKSERSLTWLPFKKMMQAITRIEIPPFVPNDRVRSPRPGGARVAATRSTKMRIEEHAAV